MEALRNYVQHRGIPVHTVAPKPTWTFPRDDPGRFELNMRIYTEKSFLIDSQFKSSVLREMPDKVDLIFYMRKYLESLSSIHTFARELIEPSVSEARSAVALAHERYGRIYPGKLTGLVAQKTDGPSVVKTIPLLLEWDDVRIQLQARNQKLDNLSKQYVSNKSNDTDK